MQVLVMHQSSLHLERDNLNLLNEFLAHTPTSKKDLARFCSPSQLLYKGLFACRPTQAPQHSFRNALEAITRGPTQHFYLYIGLPEQRAAIEQSITFLRPCWRVCAGACGPVKGAAVTRRI